MIIKIDLIILKKFSGWKLNDYAFEKSKFNIIQYNYNLNDIDFYEIDITKCSKKKYWAMIGQYGIKAFNTSTHKINYHKWG